MWGCGDVWMCLMMHRDSFTWDGLVGIGRWVGVWNFGWLGRDFLAKKRRETILLILGVSWWFMQVAL